MAQKCYKCKLEIGGDAEILSTSDKVFHRHCFLYIIKLYRCSYCFEEFEESQFFEVWRKPHSSTVPCFALRITNICSLPFVAFVITGSLGKLYEALRNVGILNASSATIASKK
ncbi:hypothetical protein RF11_05508 [Thelohanellus kitauei]|uniref:Uncharacterized protein n=1 Tax=Thelohanellus kitauei TaxID=669202 RepID=A0A0C2J6F3_THEKT|nr:hypothetical protein RF11_05508 [Thelohanellus kitauei]